MLVVVVVVESLVSVLLAVVGRGVGCSERVLVTESVALNVEPDGVVELLPIIVTLSVGPPSAAGAACVRCAGAAGVEDGVAWASVATAAAGGSVVNRGDRSESSVDGMGSSRRRRCSWDTIT